MKSLKQKYQEQIIPILKKELGVSNILALPRLEKIVMNIGIGRGLKDPKFIENCEKTLTKISGQKPVFTLAKKSISAFKIREGMKVGLKVTLRGGRAYDFLEKLIKVALPRVRDFRGIDPKGIDKQGNLTIGFREHMVFPEIKMDEIDSIHGLEVTIQTTAKNQKEGLAYFKAINFPFKTEQ